MINTFEITALEEPERSMSQKRISRKKLAYIHIVKKELDLSDSEYRDILKEVAGVRSAKYLNERKFRKLMDYLVRSGRYYIQPGGLTIKQKLFMRLLANNMGWNDIHLNNFVHRYYHKSNINELTRKEATNAIESLKRVREHAGAKQETGREQT